MEEFKRGRGRPRKITTTEGTENEKDDIEVDSEDEKDVVEDKRPAPTHRGMVYNFSPFFNA